MSDKITFCIPVRGGSRRIPRKNLLMVGNETLLARKIRQVKPLGKVVVGSDDDAMLEEAERAGAIAVKREKTNEGEDTANDMIREFMSLIEPCETVVWAHCTNPLLSTQTYANALSAYKSIVGYDSLVSVHEIHGHFWKNEYKALYNVYECKERHVCANDLAPLYEQDGGIFIQPYEQMRLNGYFFGDKPMLFKIPEDEFLDINTPRDVTILNAILGYN